MQVANKPAVRVSVVVPSWHGDIGRLERSLEQQTFRDFELIVVDHVKPAGLARNQGVARARGELLLFADDDAYLGHPRVLEQLVATIDGDCAIGVAGPSKLLPPDASRLQKRIAAEIPRWVYPVHDRDTESNPPLDHYGFTGITSTCCLVRRSVFDEVGGFDPGLEKGQDTEFFFRVRRAGHRFIIPANCWVFHDPPPSLRILLRKSFKGGIAHAIEARRNPERGMNVVPLDSWYGKLFTLLSPLLFVPSIFVSPVWEPARALRLGFRPIKALSTLLTFYGYVYGWYSFGRSEQLRGGQTAAQAPANARVATTTLRALAWPAYKNRAEQPYNAMLYSQMASQGLHVDEFYPYLLLKRRYSIFHLHWPDSLLNERNALVSFIKARALLLYMDAARAKGLKIVWTVHNLNSHEHRYPRLEAWFWKAFLPRVHGYINLSNAGHNAAQLRFPQLETIPGFVVPLGHYRGQYPDQVSREQARAALGIAPTAKVVLFIGKVRPYKNVPHLIQTFGQLDDQDARLLVAGSPNSPVLKHEIERSAALDRRVACELRFIPDERVQLYLRAADLVALPYREILNSGSALLALSFDRPVLVPLRGAMGDVQTSVGSLWVRTYEGELGARQLAEALHWATAIQRPARAPLDALDWSKLAGLTIDAYAAIAERST